MGREEGSTRRRDLPGPVQFKYQVSWIPTNHTFDTRFEFYLDADVFEHKVLVLMLDSLGFYSQLFYYCLVFGVCCIFNFVANAQERYCSL